MSYARGENYIYPTGDGVSFNGTYLDDSELNVWLYKILLKGRRKDLIERLKNGQATSDRDERKIISTFSKDDDKQRYLDFIKSMEDLVEAILEGEDK